MAGQRGWPQFMLRVSPEEKEWIEGQADGLLTSQNSVIRLAIQERMKKSAASDARRKAATGEVHQAMAPAAAQSEAALQGGAIITQAYGVPR